MITACINWDDSDIYEQVISYGIARQFKIKKYAYDSTYIYAINEIEYVEENGDPNAQRIIRFGFICESLAYSDRYLTSKGEANFRSNSNKKILNLEESIYPAYTYGELMNKLGRDNQYEIDELGDKLLSKKKMEDMK